MHVSTYILTAIEFSAGRIEQVEGVYIHYMTDNKRDYKADESLSTRNIAARLNIIGKIS